MTIHSRILGGAALALLASTAMAFADDKPVDGTAPKGVTVLPTRVAISADGSVVLAGDSAGQLHAWPTGAAAPAK